jgi:hypothetical protein
VSKISRASNATGVHSSPPRWPGVEWTRICHWNTLGWMGGYASIASGNGVSRRPAFVGRTREFEELRSALSAGFGSFVLVSGEPGIGKSRLLQEVAGYATDQGWQVLPGRCWDGGGAPAYWPWMQVVRAAGEEFERLGSASTEPVAPDAARFQLFDRVGRFLAGYAAVWTAFGAVAFLGDIGLHELVHRWPWLEAHPQVIAGSVLMLAGEFQFSKLKDRCLSECRHPASFLLQHYGRGVGAAFRLGRAHGLFCLGCCWALMLVGFAAGVANLWWMAVLTAVMVFEKSGRGGDRGVVPIGIALIALGGLVLIVPSWPMFIAPS